MSDEAYTLWPGSKAAVDAGCLCPVVDNGNGNVEVARQRGGWWQFSGCPVHGPEPAPIPAQPGSQPIVSDDDGEAA